MLGKAGEKINRISNGLLPYPPPHPPPGKAFLRIWKFTPIFSFGTKITNGWNILHLVPFQNFMLLFFDYDLLLASVRAPQASFKAGLIAVYMTNARPNVKHVLGVLEWFYMLSEKILF